MRRGKYKGCVFRFLEVSSYERKGRLNELRQGEGTGRRRSLELRIQSPEPRAWEPRSPEYKALEPWSLEQRAQSLEPGSLEPGAQSPEPRPKSLGA